MKEIAKRIIQWLKNTILKAKSRGMGSEDWVTDAKKAQDIIANAVAQYTKQQDAVGKDIKFHKAFHGSPHDHDKFDSSKIGTGEGVQAYGYGHYFTDTKEVAEYYKEKLTEDRLVSINNASIFVVSGVNVVQGTFTYADGSTRQSPWLEEKELSELIGGDKAREIFDNANTKGVYLEDEDLNVINTGKLYEVELAPKQDEYLLWDKPLSEQSEKVKRALADILPAGELNPDGLDMGGSVLRDNRERQAKPDSPYPWVLAFPDGKMFDLTQKDVDRMLAEAGEKSTGELS